MKTAIRASLLLLAFAFASFAQTAEPIKDLGDGFQSKRRTEDRNEYVLIHFPEKYLDTFEHFQQGASIGLVKQFGCDAFPKCQPELKVVRNTEGAPTNLTVKINGIPAEIYTMHASADDGAPVGIGLVVSKGTPA